MEKQAHEGERLLILVRRSKKPNTEIAQLLEITPNSLSRLFKTERLSKKVKGKAARAFGVREEYFEDEAPAPAEVKEPVTPYLKPEDEVTRLRRENDELMEQNRKLIEIIDKMASRK